MNDQDRIEIAQEFISKHKNADLDEWRVGLPDLPYSWLTDEKILLRIYDRMAYGTYGTAETETYGKFCLEISQFESASGRPELVDWEDEETYRAVLCLDDEDDEI